MNKIVQVRLNDNYINKLNFIKKFISEDCSTSFLLKYCINSTYQNIKKIVNKDTNYYKEKGL